MRITDNIFINWNNINKEFTLGFHNEPTLISWIPVNEESDDLTDENFEEGYRFIIGFLFFNIVILY